MGWLDPHHQRKMRKKYKVRIFYWCDIGDHPVPPGEPPVVDPRRGYHRRPKGISTWVSREPRWTCCLKCDRERRDAIRHKRDHKQRKFLRVVNKVVEKIAAKPKRGYWTLEKLFEKMNDDSRTVNRAVQALMKDRTLKKRDGAYLIRRK